MSIVVPPRGTRGSGLPKGVRVMMRVMQGPFHFAFRRFGDRMKVAGRPLVELETVGGMTGTTRYALLGSFPDASAERAGDSRASNERWIVVASNGGSARHPAW